uniref:Ephrin-A3a n=1 Tax=Pundamilia nyererei TaxID=303518 RepID=A0A3B4FUG6_9CICH
MHIFLFSTPSILHFHLMSPSNSLYPTPIVPLYLSLPLHSPHHLNLPPFLHHTNPLSKYSPFEAYLRREGYTVQVSVNDYLDIYCPHYNTSQRGTLERVVAEQYILYMVDYHGYRTCNTQKGSKRWECNRPHAPHAPIKFSEKFQRYSAFSLGYEFNVGKEYYYISTPTHHHHGHSCLRLRVFVCCSTGETRKICLNEFNPEVPKLEKSVSGSSPSRDRLLLTVAMLLVSAVLLS